MHSSSRTGSTVVLLGASNMALGWPCLMRCVFRRLPQPVHVLTAHGMGRAYLASSRFGVRVLPAIRDCGLWKRLPDDPPPQAALISDIGNDLAYGQSPHAVALAVADIAARLQRHSGCSISVVRPPAQSLQKLSPFRYRLLRSLLFPTCRLSLSALLAAVQDLDERLQKISGIDLVASDPAWYGADPIHMMRRCRVAAFTAYLDPWSFRERTPARPHRQLLRRPTPEETRFPGFRRTVQQPSICTKHGTVSAW